MRNTLPESRIILPALRLEDGKSRLVLESPTEQSPASIQAENVTASKETDRVCRTILLESMTSLLANASMVAKNNITLLHHLNTRVLDLATSHQTIRLSEEIVMMDLKLVSKRQSGLRSDMNLLR